MTSFTSQSEVNAAGIGVAPHSAPAPVQLGDNLYLFYSGSGNDGIYYTKLIAGSSHWTPIINTSSAGAEGAYFAPNTGPCAVVYKKSIYLFFNGVGYNGTWYTTSTPSVSSSWTPSIGVQGKIGPMGFQHETSPTAAVFQNKIYLFWSGSGNDGLFYATYDGLSWKGQYFVNPPGGMGIRNQTSPAATVFNGTLYLFYNGSGNDGTWYTTLDHNGNWTQTVSIRARIGRMDFLDGTSPAVLADGSGSELIVIWVGSQDKALWYSRFQGIYWTLQTSLKEEIGGQALLDGCSAGAVATGAGNFESKIFWVGSNRTLLFSTNLQFDLDTLSLENLMTAFEANATFVCYSQDPTMLQYFQSRMTITPTQIPEDPTGFVNWLVGGLLNVGTIDGIFLNIMCALSEGVRRGYTIIGRTDPPVWQFIPPPTTAAVRAAAEPQSP